MSVGALSSFLSYANQYTKPFNEISNVFTELQTALACASRVFHLLDIDSSPKQGPTKNTFAYSRTCPDSTPQFFLSR